MGTTRERLPLFSVISTKVASSSDHHRSHRSLQQTKYSADPFLPLFINFPQNICKFQKSSISLNTRCLVDQQEGGTSSSASKGDLTVEIIKEHTRCSHRTEHPRHGFPTRTLTFPARPPGDCSSRVHPSDGSCSRLHDQQLIEKTGLLSFGTLHDHILIL